MTPGDPVGAAFGPPPAVVAVATDATA